MSVGFKERIDFNANYKTKYSDADERKDGYQLKWVGKTYAHWLAGSATETMIYPDELHNNKPENKHSENIFITGDNLDVLKNMRKAYRNSINIIYIDPPYNTGSDGFVYKDKYILSDDILVNNLGFSEDEINRLRTIEGRGSHSAWLTFMYPRLRIAQELLTEEGVIFISIDDNEIANLKLLCDEIFGENNFIDIFSWVKTASPPSLSKKTRKSVEYIICYEKNLSDIAYKAGEAEGGDHPLLNASNSVRKLCFSANTIKFTNRNIFADGIVKPQFGERVTLLNSFEIKDGMNAMPIELEGAFKWQQNFLDNEIAKGTEFIIQTKNFAIRYIRKDIRYKKPNNYIQEKYIAPLLNKDLYNIGTNAEASKETIKLFGEKYFDYPKPVSLIKYICSFVSDIKNPIILDFFAGSGTTAHAVMELNKEDGGNRKYILCQLDEETAQNSVAAKAGYNTIDEITNKRIELAAAQLNDKSGYKKYYVKQPNNNILKALRDFNPELMASEKVLLSQNYIELFANKATNSSGEQTILTSWLLQDRYQFTEQPELIYIKDYKAYYINKTLYLLERGWNDETNKELLNMIKRGELICDTIVIYGYYFSFKTLNSLKVNIKTCLDENYKINIIQRY